MHICTNMQFEGGWHGIPLPSFLEHNFLRLNIWVDLICLHSQTSGAVSPSSSCLSLACSPPPSFLPSLFLRPLFNHFPFSLFLSHVCLYSLLPLQLSPFHFLLFILFLSLVIFAYFFLSATFLSLLLLHILHIPLSFHATFLSLFHFRRVFLAFSSFSFVYVVFHLSFQNDKWHLFYHEFRLSSSFSSFFCRHLFPSSLFRFSFSFFPLYHFLSC